MDVILPANLNEELLRLASEVESASMVYRRHALKYARAEHVYRARKATVYTQLVAQDKERPRKEQRTVPALTAEVDILCEQERLHAYLAEALKQASKERLESLRASLSAVQSVAAAVRAEMDLARIGPQRDA